MSHSDRSDIHWSSIKFSAILVSTPVCFCESTEAKIAIIPFNVWDEIALVCLGQRSTCLAALRCVSVGCVKCWDGSRHTARILQNCRATQWVLGRVLDLQACPLVACLGRRAEGILAGGWFCIWIYSRKLLQGEHWFSGDGMVSFSITSISPDIHLLYTWHTNWRPCSDSIFSSDLAIWFDTVQRCFLLSIWNDQVESQSKKISVSSMLLKRQVIP